MNEMSPLKIANNAIFESYQKNKKPFVLVVLDEWCPACQEYKPIVEYFAEKYSEDVSMFIVRTAEMSKYSILKNLKKINVIPYSLFYIGDNLCCETPGSMRFEFFRTAIINLINMSHCQ